MISTKKSDINPKKSQGYVMKNDYQCLIELWKKEVVIREKRDRLVAWKNSIESRKKDCMTMQKEINALTIELEDPQKQLDEMDGYFQKTEQNIEKLKNSISGNALDRYELVLQQIEQLERAKDEKELEYLEVLERQEKKKQRKGIVILQLDAQKRRLVVEAQRWKTEGEVLKNDIRMLKLEQADIFPFMNDRVAKQYQNLAKEHPQVLSKIRGGICSHCDVAIPLMLRADVEDREMVRSCATCRAFLISAHEDCS